MKGWENAVMTRGAARLDEKCQMATFGPSVQGRRGDKKKSAYGYNPEPNDAVKCEVGSETTRTLDHGREYGREKRLEANLRGS